MTKAAAETKRWPLASPLGPGEIRPLLMQTVLLFGLILLLGSRAYAQPIYSVEDVEEDGLKKQVLMVQDGEGGKKYRGPSEYLVTIVTEADFDKDGVKDALVTTYGGGTCCPEDYHVVTLKKGKLIVADLESDFSDKKVKEEGGSTYIVDTKSDRAEFYSFNGEKLVLSKTVKSLKALRELHGPGGLYIDPVPPKTMLFDINGDGKKEKITCSVWTRWGSLLCELPLPGGKTQELHTGCQRFGVLASRNNGYHEFVCDFDTVVTFDGKRWVPKANPGKGF